MRTISVRVTSFVGGVLLSAYMYLLVTATALGSSPLFVFEEGIATLTGAPFGVVTAANGIFLLTLAAIMRAPVGPGTLSVPLMFGLCVELLTPVVPTIDGSAPGGFVLRIALLVLATHLMALGGALVVRAAFGAAAIDAVMLGLSKVLRRDTARVRMAMEVTLAAGGAALGGAAGVGTILAGLTVGHSFRFWAKRMGIAGVGTRRASTVRRGAQPSASEVAVDSGVEPCTEGVGRFSTGGSRSSSVGSAGSESISGSGATSVDSTVISVRRTTKSPAVPISSMLSIATRSPS